MGAVHSKEPYWDLSTGREVVFTVPEVTMTVPHGSRHHLFQGDGPVVNQAVFKGSRAQASWVPLRDLEVLGILWPANVPLAL